MEHPQPFEPEHVKAKRLMRRYMGWLGFAVFMGVFVLGRALWVAIEAGWPAN
jgi:hypothetical protein